MARHTDTETCPNSTHIPPALVDDEGFCNEHGWDCGEYDLFAKAKLRAGMDEDSSDDDDQTHVVWNTDTGYSDESMRFPSRGDADAWIAEHPEESFAVRTEQ